METLQDVLRANSKHLTHLELEYVNGTWDDISDDEDTDDDEDMGAFQIKDGSSLNYFAREIFGLSQPVTTLGPTFPALDVLSLAFIPLEKAQKTLTCAFNVGMLSQLTLRSCPGTEDFLRAIVLSNQTLKLTSLEYMCEPEEDIDVSQALESIFGIAPNLTDVFLSLPGPMMTLDLWRAMANQGMPLTRFIYHLRSSEINPRSPRFEEITDLDDLGLLRDDMKWLKRAGEEHPFARLNLKCLGLGAHPSVVVWQAPTHDLSL
jgi:hypothetical protein